MTAPILIVDDSAVVRALHAYILKMEGYETLQAENGLIALEILKSTPCALAVVDVNMPRMDGFQLTRSVRGDPMLTHLPIIIVSTLQENQDQMRGFRAGANTYIIKPTEPDVLIASVRSLLQL